MARFDPLTNYLAQLDTDSVILTFDEVESLAGTRLPRSARKAGSSFWSNSPRNIYARHWLAAGYEAGFDDCDEHEICFRRHADDDGGQLVDQPPPVAPPPPEPPPPPPLASLPPPPTEVTRPVEAARLAHELADAFTLGRAELVERRGAGAPLAGWDHLPEASAAGRLRAAGTDDVRIRLVLTFGGLIARGRYRPELWSTLAERFTSAPDLFDPDALCARPLGDLAAALADGGVTRRLTDAAHWRLLAETLQEGTAAPAVTTVVFAGIGDAGALGAELSGANRPIPALAGPTAFRRWVRALVQPGGATVSNVASLGVVVDGDVRRATELLGLTPPRRSPAVESRDQIEAMWAEACRTNPPPGPPGLDGTPLALDQALAYHGRVGCLWCRVHTRIEPIGPACGACVLRAAERSS